MAMGQTVSITIDYRPALLGTAGIGRAVRELVRAMAGLAGLQLHLFAHSLAGAATPSRPPAGARLHRLPIPGRFLGTLARMGLGADRLGGRGQLFHWTDYIHPPLSMARAVLTLHDLAFTRDPSFHGPDQATLLLERTRRAAAGAARFSRRPDTRTGSCCRQCIRSEWRRSTRAVRDHEFLAN